MTIEKCLEEIVAVLLDVLWIEDRIDISQRLDMIGTGFVVDDANAFLAGLWVDDAVETVDIPTYLKGCLVCILRISRMVVDTNGQRHGNLFLKTERKINPLIGNAGVSAVPDSARVSEVVGREANPNNHLLMHAMAPNVAGVIGSAVAAGILLGFLG